MSPLYLHLLHLPRLLLILSAALLTGCEQPTTLYVFTSPTCGPCKRDYPKVRALIKTGAVNVKVISVDRDPEVAKEFNVVSVPTYMLFSNNKLVLRTHNIDLVIQQVKGRR